MENSENTFNLIYEVVRQIPRGTVATYGQVAALAGNATAKVIAATRTTEMSFLNLIRKPPPYIIRIK